jgi:hypothetical protein
MVMFTGRPLRAVAIPAERPPSKYGVQSPRRPGNFVNGIEREEVADIGGARRALACAAEDVLGRNGVRLPAAERSVVDGVRPHVVRVDQQARMQRAPGGKLQGEKRAVTLWSGIEPGRIGGTESSRLQDRPRWRR